MFVQNFKVGIYLYIIQEYSHSLTMDQNGMFSLLRCLNDLLCHVNSRLCHKLFFQCFDIS